MYNHNKPHGVPLAKPAYPSVSNIRNRAADIELARELNEVSKSDKDDLLELLKDIK